MVTLKEMLENQEQIRSIIFKMLQKEPKSMRKLSGEIGIGINTLIRFLNGSDVEFVSLRKIMNWIKEHE